jgi:hypothetical protein
MWGCRACPQMQDAFTGDADSVTLIDVSKRPFRAVQYFTVPSIAEGAAIFPGWEVDRRTVDGWIDLPEDNPGRHPQGRVLLFLESNIRCDRQCLTTGFLDRFCSRVNGPREAWIRIGSLCDDGDVRPVLSRAQVNANPMPRLAPVVNNVLWFREAI